MTDRATTLNTKRMLARCLREAAAHKPISRITVTELVTASGLNRKTFYYHFQDVPDLLAWMLDDEAIDVVHQFHLPAEFDEALDFALQYVERNRALLRNAYTALGPDKLRSLFYLDFEALVRTVLDEQPALEASGVGEDYDDFLVHFCTEGLAAQLIDWILDRSKLDRATLSRYVVLTLRRQPSQPRSCG